MRAAASPHILTVLDSGDTAGHLWLTMPFVEGESLRDRLPLWPISRDAMQGAYIEHQLARIYAITGEHDKTIDALESLLKIPYYLSPGWLRIDPEFAMLKGNPRFDKLIAGS